MITSFTSQVENYLVRSSEVVSGLPGDLDYSRNGMIYGSRLFEATRSLRIHDPEFAANLDEHFRQCVFYDVLLGRYSMETLVNAPDISDAIGPDSQARAQRFTTWWAASPSPASRTGIATPPTSSGSISCSPPTTAVKATCGTISFTRSRTAPG